MSASSMLFGAALGAIAASVLLSTSARCEVQYIGYAYVHDGDTLRIANQSFRLYGIDAPELTEQHGIEARNMLRDIIREQQVLCTPTGERSYKRLVAMCATPIYSDLGAELVRRGAALDCARYSHGQYRALEPMHVRDKIEQKRYCK